MIESAKLTFSKIGIHTYKGYQGAMYMPRIVLRIRNRKAGKTGYLELNRFEKKDYQGLAILPDFIVVITTKEYIIVDEDLKEKAALPVEETGKIIGVQKEGFLCVKDNTLRLYDIAGQVIGERELTAEEIASLNQ